MKRPWLTFLLAYLAIGAGFVFFGALKDRREHGRAQFTGLELLALVAWPKVLLFPPRR